jgi:hypothetical protein
LKINSYYGIKVQTNFIHNLLIKNQPTTEDSILKINLLNHTKVKKDFVSSSEIFFNKADIGAYEILGGNTINIYPHKNINADTLLYYGLQIPFGCACAQNQKIVFHASVAEKDGKCFAFLGNPGAGKSSLLIKLLENEWNFITEDICVVDDNYNLNFISSFPYIKLSNEVAQSHSNKLIPTDINTDKLGRKTYQIDTLNLSSGGVLESIFFLDWGQGLNLYQPAESTKLRLLLNYIVPSFQSKAGDLHIDSYKKILKLMDSLPIFVLERPRSLANNDIQAIINKINSLT